jgi:hypothetical protein
LWDVEDPTLCRQMAVRWSAGLLPRNIFVHLVLISVRGLSKPQGLVPPEGLGQLMKIIHFFRSRNDYLPTYGIAP